MRRLGGRVGMARVCFVVLAIISAQFVAGVAGADPGPLSSVDAREISESEVDAILESSELIELIVNEDGAIIGELFEDPDGTLHEVYIGDPNRYEEIWANEAFEAHDPSSVSMRLFGSNDPYEDFETFLARIGVEYEDLIFGESLVDSRGAIVGEVVYHEDSDTLYDIIFVDLDKIDVSSVVLRSEYYETNPFVIYYSTGNITPVGYEDPTTTTTEATTTTTEATTTTTEATTTTTEATTTTTEATTTTTEATTTTTEATTTTTEATTTTTEATTTTTEATTTTTEATTTTTSAGGGGLDEPPKPPTKPETPDITG